VKDDRVYLGHILERIARIEAYTKGGRQAFMDDTMIQDAVIQNLEVVGEATNNLSESFRKAHPEVDWRRAINLRNVLIHNYVGAQQSRVWADVTLTVPPLKRHVEALLTAGPHSDNPDTAEIHDSIEPNG
jgi:uncharacterized protein with HEPN domain